jgi:hypothetical protein
VVNARWQLPVLLLLVVILRLAFLHQPIQGDDPYYLYGAEHAQTDPLHPTHAQYIFQGDMVDMRGHPHGPLDSWILGGCLAMFGRVNEAPFHAVYILFSLIAVWAMWSLARRFSDQPFWATLLFIAVPAFVVNGNSLEADLPFLAFWLASVALFVRAVDSEKALLLAISAVCGALAALDAYQAILLVPILGVYLFDKRRPWIAAWAALLAAPLAIAAFQLFERSTSGALPAAMFTGYMKTYGLQDLVNKFHSGAALTAHMGWIVSPIIAIVAFTRKRTPLIVAIVAALAAAFYDHDPLFWLSIGVGVLVVGANLKRGFLNLWVAIFFAAALIIFYAGSARYLLPLAAPVCILAVRDRSRILLASGFALQLALSLGLAMMNYQHWDAYRQFAKQLPASPHKMWVNAEWGLRWYLEQRGGIAIPRDQIVQTGDVVVTSELAGPLRVNGQFAPIAQMEIRPSVPLRIIALDRRSAYSAASATGLLPFEVSRGVVDRVRAEVALERKPQLIWIDPRDPAAAPQMLSGLWPDSWTSKSANILLKQPDHAMPLRIDFYIPKAAAARHVQLFVDGELVGDRTYPEPQHYVMATPPMMPAGPVTITITVDKTVSTPEDHRAMGIILVGAGFRQ